MVQLHGLQVTRIIQGFITGLSLIRRSTSNKNICSPSSSSPCCFKGEVTTFWLLLFYILWFLHHETMQVLILFSASHLGFSAGPGLSMLLKLLPLSEQIITCPLLLWKRFLIICNWASSVCAYAEWTVSTKSGEVFLCLEYDYKWTKRVPSFSRKCYFHLNVFVFNAQTNLKIQSFFCEMVWCLTSYGLLLGWLNVRMETFSSRQRWFWFLGLVLVLLLLFVFAFDRGKQPPLDCIILVFIAQCVFEQFLQEQKICC